MNTADEVSEQLNKISNKNYKRAKTVAKAVHAELVKLTDKWNKDWQAWEIENGFKPTTICNHPILFQDHSNNDIWLLAWEDCPIPDPYGYGWIGLVDNCVWQNGDRIMEPQNSCVASFCD